MNVRFVSRPVATRGGISLPSDTQYYVYVAYYAINTPRNRLFSRHEMPGDVDAKINRPNASIRAPCAVVARKLCHFSETVDHRKIIRAVVEVRPAIWQCRDALTAGHLSAHPNGNVTTEKN